MAIRAYGKSVKSYTAWEAETEYELGDFRVPTTDNGVCYECTQAGTSGLSEPSWDTTIGGTIKENPLPPVPPAPPTQSVIWTCREKEGEANPLAVTIDVKDAGGYSLKDIWVTNNVVDGRSDFALKGSYDNVNFRTLTGSPLQVAAAAPAAHKGLQNAYPYIKVECLDTLISEIEIVASQP